MCHEVMQDHKESGLGLCDRRGGLDCMDLQLHPCGLAFRSIVYNEVCAGFIDQDSTIMRGW